MNNKKNIRVGTRSRNVPTLLSKVLAAEIQPLSNDHDQGSKQKKVAER